MSALMSASARWSDSGVARPVTFTLTSQGRDLVCAVTRDALERHILLQRESDYKTLFAAFERGLRRIIAAAERKSLVLRNTRVLVTASDLGEA